MSDYWKIIHLTCSPGTPGTGYDRDCQERLLIVLDTCQNDLTIPRRQVETGKCGQGRLLIVLGTSLYFLSLPIAGEEGGVGLGRDCQKRLLIMTGTSLYFITYI